MTWWMILLVVILVVILLSQLRIGAAAEYGPVGIRIFLRVAGIGIPVFPSAGRTKDGKQKKKKKVRANKAIKQPKDSDSAPGSLAQFMEILPLLAQAAGALLRKIRIDDLFLSVVWGGREDAAAAALGYGKANAAIGMIWPLLDHNFKVKSSSFHVDVDYNAQRPVVAAKASATLTVGQIFSLVIRYGVKLLTSRVQSKRSNR